MPHLNHQQLTPPPECGDMQAVFPKPGDSSHDINNRRHWTDDLPNTEHVRFFRHRNWAATSLGPLEGWSSTLRTFVRMVMADSRAACLWWGPNLVAIYNDAYRPLSGNAHPDLMGGTFQQCYPDLWASICPYFERARQTGIGEDYSSSQSLVVERKSWREEAFFTGNFVPVGDGPTNQPTGFYNSLFEVTDQRLAERRTQMLNLMAAVPDLLPDNVAQHIVDTLKTNSADIPMAVLYELEETTELPVMKLRGHIGIPNGHNLLIDGLPLSSNEGLLPDCRRAGLDPFVIDYDERFDSISWQGFGQPSKKIAILPVVAGKRASGYLITGTNPYRPFDEPGEQFLKDLNRMVSSIVSTTINSEESKKRQVQLENDLAFSDQKLRHLIEHASVGMVNIGINGDTLWANEQYYVLSGLSPNNHDKWAFFDAYLEEDRSKAERVWKSLRTSADHISVELRLKRLFNCPVGDPQPAQLQVLAFPYFEHGKVKSIMACTWDISRLKWAQTFQARLAAEAREAKRQQEAFIDVVSHEMRNPLSAIVHCADEISKSLEDCQAKLASIPEPCLSTIHDNVASANIIMQCANHQKRIIDDVLTLSKLDSMLLSITPTPVRPRKMVHSISNIFEAELKSNHIRYDVVPDASLAKLDIDYLYFDPSRVTQIFINLVTNAIKFVKTSAKPTISIRYGAATSRPHDFFPADMFWATKDDQNKDMTTNPEWGNGEVVYLNFIVQDTGIGLQPKEIHKIFERFRQANMRTHVKYGGSGLGLFISKELTEKQGGEIGVSSLLGQGSTFGFYIKARRVQRVPQTMGELYKEADLSPNHPLHILLVEDNVINQQVLGRQLKKAGCTIDIANHGLEALDLLSRSPYDVVLMDLEMPVMDGMTAMREIRRREGEGQYAKWLPMIAVTANVRQEQVDTAIAAGADRVMQKPFKAAELVHMMKDLVPHAPEQAAEPPTPDLIEHKNGILG